MNSPEGSRSLQVQPGSRPWTDEEDDLLIQLDERHEVWAELPNILPGRSFASCQARYIYIKHELHRSEVEETKRSVAMLYERLKKDIWLQIATEMWMVWTEAERMHWHLGKAQLKKRGTDDSFRTTPVNVDNLPLPQVDDSQVQAPIQQQQVASRMGLPWSGDEEGILFACRDAKMSWNQISDRLPGRNPRSCQRQHSLLARGPAWSQERKNKLCKLYESLKPTMWAKIGDQLHIPWQTVEDMHWSLEPRNITSSSVPRPEGTVPSGAHGARGRRDGLDLGSSVTVPGILEFDEGVKLLHQQAKRETYGRR